MYFIKKIRGYFMKVSFIAITNTKNDPLFIGALYKGQIYYTRNPKKAFRFKSYKEAYNVAIKDKRFPVIVKVCE